MKIHPEPQGSPEWLTARAGVITASEFSDFMTSDFELRKGEMVRTALAKKLAERWTGEPLPAFSTYDMEQGKVLEDECLPAYEFITGEPIQRVGLITTDCGRIGCSPDGLIGEDGGIEAKCPRIENHLKYLLAGKVPTDYLCQVHGALFVTGRKWWRFVSFSRRMPMLSLRVERNQEIQDKIKAALDAFTAQLDEAYGRLVEINGGEPKRREVAA